MTWVDTVASSHACSHSQARVAADESTLTERRVTGHARLMLSFTTSGEETLSAEEEIEMVGVFYLITVRVT